MKLYQRVMQNLHIDHVVNLQILLLQLLVVLSDVLHFVLCDLKSIIHVDIFPSIFVQEE